MFIGIVTEKRYEKETDCTECTVQLLDDETINSPRVRRSIENLRSHCANCITCEEYRNVSKK